ncbi:MAG: tetratricopeptide repeat protein [Anaerolineales bacterium]|nr:MAG: tetratricopeptide repeat protein [Anaerolineales bacterium]
MLDTLDFKPIFVGRETEQQVFSSTLDEITQKLRSSNWQFWLPTRKASRDLVYLIYGEGGIGKSTLLNKFAELTQNYKSPISLIKIDWEHEQKIGNLPTDFEDFIKLLYRSILTNQPKQAPKNFRDFQEVINNRGDLQKKIDTKYRPEARKEFDLLVSTLAGPLGKATEVTTGIPSEGTEKAITETVHQLSGGLAKFEDFFSRWLRKNLTVDEQNLYFSSDELYSAKFNTGLTKLTQTISMVVVFDTYEWIVPIPVLDEKIRSLLIIPLLKSTNRIAFVISGRNDLSVDYRRSFEGTTFLRVFPVLPFDTDVEIRQYLIESGLPENLKEVVTNKTMGIPQAVAALTSILKKSNKDVEIDDPARILISESDESHVVDETTLRFLRYCYESVGDAPEIAQHKRLDRQKVFALTLLRRYDLGALTQCWEIIGGKQPGSPTEVNKDLVELRRRHSFVFDQGRDRMHELVKQFTRKFLRYQIDSDQGFIDRNLVQQLTKRLDDYFDATRKQHSASSKSLANRYTDIAWLGATLDLIYSRYWYDEQAGWELVAKTYLEAIAFNKAWLKNVENLINDHRLTDSRMIQLFVNGIEAALLQDISDEVEKDLLNFIARQTHWNFSDTHKALICLRQAILLNRGNQEKRALEKLLEAISYTPENEVDLRNSVIDELVSVGAWLMIRREYESAETALSQVLVTDKNRTEIRGLLIMVLLSQSKIDDAEKYLESVNTKDSTQLLFARSQINLAKGRTAESVADYKAALRLNPNIFDNILDELSDPKAFDFVRELLRSYISGLSTNTSQLDASVIESITTAEDFKKLMKINNQFMGIETPTSEDRLKLSESLVNLLPNNGDLKINLIESQIAAQRYKEATNTVNQLIASDPSKSAQANLQLGKINLHQKRPKNALVYVEKSLEENPDNLEAQKTYAQLLVMSKRRKDAIELMKNLVKKHPEDAGLRWALSSNLRAVGKLDESNEQMRLAIQIDPKYLEKLSETLINLPTNLLDYFIMGTMSVENKAMFSYLDKETRVQVIKQLIKEEILGKEVDIDLVFWSKIADSVAKKAKDIPRDMRLLGEWYERAQQYTQAENAYKRAIELDTSDPAVQLKLANIYILLNQQESAIPFLIKSAELKPRAAPYLVLAKIYEKKGSNQEALDAYQKAIELEPNNADAINSLASYYDNQGNMSDAITTFTRAISLEPKRGYLYRNRADQYIKSNQLENAQSDLEIAQQLEPNASFLYLRFAEFYICKREFDKVEENALKALEIDNEFTNARLLLALAYLYQRKTLDALDQYRSAIPKADESGLKDAKEKLDEVIKELGQVSGADIVLNMVENALSNLREGKNGEQKQS